MLHKINSLLSSLMDTLDNESGSHMHFYGILVLYAGTPDQREVPQQVSLRVLNDVFQNLLCIVHLEPLV